MFVEKNFLIVKGQEGKLNTSNLAVIVCLLLMILIKKGIHLIYLK